MKKGTILNRAISDVIASMGHTDMLVIADAGLPIPDETRRIDIALVRGIPSFSDTLHAVLSEMAVEGAVMAEESSEHNPRILAEVKQALGDDIAFKQVPHQDFKALTRSAKAVIRTGECTPYANVILIAGVAF